MARKTIKALEAELAVAESKISELEEKLSDTRYDLMKANDEVCAYKKKLDMTTASERSTDQRMSEANAELGEVHRFIDSLMMKDTLKERQEIKKVFDHSCENFYANSQRPAAITKLAIFFARKTFSHD